MKPYNPHDLAGSHLALILHFVIRPIDEIEPCHFYQAVEYLTGNIIVIC